MPNYGKGFGLLLKKFLVCSAAFRMATLFERFATWLTKWLGAKDVSVKAAPNSDIVDLIRTLGAQGIPIHFRYDPERVDNKFTLIGPEGRICDTECP
jgi:hypothetical protein